MVGHLRASLARDALPYLTEVLSCPKYLIRRQRLQLPHSIGIFNTSRLPDKISRFGQQSHGFSNRRVPTRNRQLRFAAQEPAPFRPRRRVA